MGCKAAETTRNISDAFGPGIANKHTVQWWFKKFCKGDKNLEHEEYSGRPLEVDNDQLRVIIEADPVPTHKKLPKNSTSTILQSFGIWRKLERWISLISRCFTSWPEIKKIVILKCCFLLFYTTPPIISLSDCDVDEKWILYNSWWWPAQWLDWEAPKHFPKPNLNQEKGYGLCLVVCCLSDPLQFSESWQNHYIWEVYSPNRWAAPKTAITQPASVNKKGPILLHKPDRMSDNHCFKSWNKLDYEVLLYPPYLSDFSPTDYHFRHLNNFLQVKCFHNQ